MSRSQCISVGESHVGYGTFMQNQIIAVSIIKGKICSLEGMQQHHQNLSGSMCTVQHILIITFDQSSSYLCKCVITIAFQIRCINNLSDANQPIMEMQACSCMRAQQWSFYLYFILCACLLFSCLWVTHRRASRNSFQQLKASSQLPLTQWGTA